MYVEDLLDALPIPWLHGLGGGYLMAIEFTLGAVVTTILLLIVLSVLLPRNNNMGKKARRRQLLEIGSDILCDGIEAHVYRNLITREESKWLYDQMAYGLNMRSLVPGRPNNLTLKLQIMDRIEELKRSGPVRFPDSTSSVKRQARSIGEILNDLSRKRK